MMPLKLQVLRSMVDKLYSLFAVVGISYFIINAYSTDRIVSRKNAHIITETIIKNLYINTLEVQGRWGK